MSVATDIFGGPGSTGGGPSRGSASGRVVDTRRRIERRQDADVRPGGRPLSYERPRAATSRTPHRSDTQEVGWGAVVITALVTALVMAGFLGLAQWRTSDAVPDRTAVVQVRGGESLGDVAARVAPGVDTWQVVDRIVDLNALSESAVHPGQTLVVPVSATD